LPTWGLVAMLLPAGTLLLVLLSLPLVLHNWLMLAATTGAMVAGFGLYALLGMAKERGWCEFADVQV